MKESDGEFRFETHKISSKHKLINVLDVQNIKYVVSLCKVQSS